MTIRHDSLAVEWLGDATVRIETASGFVVYLDPVRNGALDDYPKDGDLVCVTHDHHYDSDGIQRAAAQDATIVVFDGVDAAAIDRDVTPIADIDRKVVRIGESDHVAVGPADVWTVPAYNDPDGPHANDDGPVAHPRGSGVGYRLSLDGVSVFWPGDGDALDAYARLDVSLFLANIGGVSATDRHESADLAERIDPDLVLPVHYDTTESPEVDSATFAADVAGRGVPVVLDERGVPR